MIRRSKKYTSLLILTLIIITSLSVGVNLLINLTGFGNTGSMRSGIFANTNQGIDSNSWYFFADEANGHSTFYANLNRMELDRLLIESRILSGEMQLVITQDQTRLVFDLNEYEMKKTAEEINTGMLEPGRIEMRLYFIYAQNIDVIASWDERR